MTDSDWSELAADVKAEREIARKNNWELLSTASIMIYRTPEGELVTRVNAEGDIDVLHASLCQLAEVSTAAQKQRRMN